eukprot:TRINITY_DN26366_c0_g4_i5.p1 TRINITY_DN26366_c0_g4~~TRINITY_DN26366_c0_g4_i5.p1  ORF type:complete len:125 (+),score=8.27 TRINITY_DN26366_c0_g4_i5:195-569(+)
MILFLKIPGSLEAEAEKKKTNAFSRSKEDINGENGSRVVIAGTGSHWRMSSANPNCFVWWISTPTNRELICLVQSIRQKDNLARITISEATGGTISILTSSPDPNTAIGRSSRTHSSYFRCRGQ